jgi:ABC-type Co2+ transport system permease subunit
MLAVSLGYVVAAAIVSMHLFADPLGSILKIFPIVIATLFVLAILDER